MIRAVLPSRRTWRIRVVRGNLAARFTPWKPIFFVLVARHPETGGRNREGRMLANVFSNTTPPRVEKAEGVPQLGLALSLCLMAAIAALAFVAARRFNT